MGRAEALQAVVIDDEGQVVQFLVAGEDQRFPVGALVPFAVGRETENTAGFTPELLGQGQAGGQRQAVAEASRGKEDVIQRQDIKNMYVTNLSAMPGDMEKQLNLQQMADVIAGLEKAANHADEVKARREVDHAHDQHREILVRLK